MKFLTTLVLMFMIFGCGSSEPVELSYKTEYVYFNARNVSENMHNEVLLNDKSDYNKSISYAKQDSYSLWWYDEDNITIKYSQDLHVSFPENPKTKGKKLYCAMGNADKTSSPKMFIAPEPKDIRQGDAYIQVINAINDSSDKRIVINNGSALSQFTSFSEISDNFYIEHGSSNSLVGLEYKTGETFLFDNIDGDSITFDAEHAYFIVMYEDERNSDTPQIAIVDMTP